MHRIVAYRKRVASQPIRADQHSPDHRIAVIARGIFEKQIAFRRGGSRLRESQFLKH
jgi:hypothetical protein